jgi:hypothetical protein
MHPREALSRAVNRAIANGSPIVTEKPTFATLTERFQRADDAWMAELVRIWGKDAGDVRYTSHARGDAGSTLRALYDARNAASDAWTNAKQYL